MPCRPSCKVDIRFWAGLKPDIWLEEEQMKSLKGVIKVSCILVLFTFWGNLIILKDILLRLLLGPDACAEDPIYKKGQPKRNSKMLLLFNPVHE